MNEVYVVNRMLLHIYIWNIMRLKKHNIDIDGMHMIELSNHRCDTADESLG